MAEAAATVRAAEISVAEIPAAEIREASQAAPVLAPEFAAVADRIRASGEFLPERARTLTQEVLTVGRMLLPEFELDVLRALLGPVRCPSKPG